MSHHSHSPPLFVSPQPRSLSPTSLLPDLDPSPADVDRPGSSSMSAAIGRRFTPSAPSYGHGHALGHHSRPRSFSRSSSSPSPPTSPRTRTHPLPEKKRTSSSSRSTRRPPLQSNHSLHYAGSASSAAFVGSEGEGSDRFVTINAEDTEVERRRLPTVRASPSPRPTPLPRVATPRVPTDVAAHPLAPRITLLPHTVRLGPLRVTLTRKRAEDAILLGAVVAGIVKLTYTWKEVAVAGELTTLLIISVAYVALRVRTIDAPSSPGRSPVPLGVANLRERSSRRNSQHGLPSLLKEDDGPVGIGSRGCIWGTEEREYRECLDDGALFALLLSPLTAAAMLHGALTRLAAQPPKATLPGWTIEQPLLIPSTPVRRITDTIPGVLAPGAEGDAIRALSALATARRNLVQLFTLLSFVLLIQLTHSLRHEIKLTRTAPGSPTMSSGSESDTPMRPHGTFWLKRGEWRRNRSVIAFAFFVTGCCVVVKIGTAYIGRSVWSDMSHSDIVIATLFYQFCLYVCVRLARRGFTLGELGIVTHAATALFMETVNMTRSKIPILSEPYIKTYRLPTPLLIFQLALIPGSLLTGFLLSPLLYLSRNMAQRPIHRLRFPHEKPAQRRLLALGFYAGAALVVVGVVGMWARWMLGRRNPWLWVLRFIITGPHMWTRPVLLAYWGGLALFAVAAWQRQLTRGRRHRTYTVSRDSTSSAGSGSTTALASDGASARTVRSHLEPSVATQMMDRADQRMPTLSVNARRKSFHALAVAMFVPGMTVDPAFTHLSFSVAFAAFTFAEYVRYFALWPLGASVHLFLNEFIDHKDSGTAILSHFYLLAGCATPLWLEGPSQVLAHFGVLSLGIGDAMASIIGRKVGYMRWSPVSGKTAEGSAGFLVSVVAVAIAMWAVGAVERFALVPFVLTTALSTLLEAFSAQNDNLVLPVYGWAVGTLLGV
ncbi:hypothetical protein CC85DRAFT_287856 [Cutaneotrichosporon oleaginosum]|uniref:dolichol kinase n=1 Tax=Cutaneotrichosporon oleaginosum TaxID=879819 RepID=A0A0J0XG85_9TREE|nr:uncharacterized protein CC85DRAFT_287856 [Cutaneotrichosporon oleaginosum]KLT40066.1 hypothetical protein CC85DRAFT_287856 [Cutaneotrichosporon oleaginosum]TXT10400.1 hypothetical protein COLE_04334 [Cutaneotrichosporon oleaginosum]